MQQAAGRGLVTARKYGTSAARRRDDIATVLDPFQWMVAHVPDTFPEVTARDTLCQECGNGQVEGDEPCDGPDLGGQSCQGLGYTGGSLSCRPWCEIDTTACTAAYCGDGVREGSEVCDGDDLGGATCGDFGYPGGSVACSGTCELDLSGCTGLDAGALDAGLPSLDAGVPEN